MGKKIAKLKDIVLLGEFNGRVSKLNFKVEGDSSKWATIKNDLYSSAVTDISDKPGEGYVTSFFWDAEGRWDTQVYIPNNSSYKPHIRYRNADTDWGLWQAFAMMSDVNAVNDRSVYDTGYNSYGRWIRFNNGYMICSNRVHNVSVYLERSLSGKGTIYYGYCDNWTKYPQTFAEVPTCIMNINTGSNVFTIQPYADGYVDRPNGFYPIGVDNGLNGTVTVNYIAIGRWK